MPMQRPQNPAFLRRPQQAGYGSLGDGSLLSDVSNGPLPDCYTLLVEVCVEVLVQVLGSLLNVRLP